MSLFRLKLEKLRVDFMKKYCFDKVEILAKLKNIILIVDEENNKFLL